MEPEEHKHKKEEMSEPKGSEHAQKSKTSKEVLGHENPKDFHKAKLSDKKEEKKEKSRAGSAKLAVIRIRNIVGATGAVRDTLKMLRLYNKNSCTILDNNKINLGMLGKIKDYVTYGEIDAETESLLQQKRGKKDKEGKMKKHFHLHPPRGGFERKGIKHSYAQGGALGYRGSKMNQLVKKMV